MSDIEDLPTVYVFFDYNCPWSYVGHLRAQRLAEHFDIELVWCGWELHPTLAPHGWPTPDVEGVRTDPVEGPAGELAAELGETFYWPPVASNTRLALRGAEYAKDQGRDTFTVYHDAVFKAVWSEGRNVGGRDVLDRIVEDAGMEPEAFREGIGHAAYDERLDAVRRAAKRLGLVRRPTFVFGDQRIAGTAAFEDSLVAPVRAFVDRWRRFGPEAVTSLDEDRGLSVLR